VVEDPDLTENSATRSSGSFAGTPRSDIVAAVDLICSQHSVAGTAAYSILVQTAADAHMSVGQTASMIVSMHRSETSALDDPHSD
jgi:hypothetical protein